MLDNFVAKLIYPVENHFDNALADSLDNLVAKWGETLTEESGVLADWYPLAH